MNAATRAAVRYCLAHGHTPIGILNGFKGLLDESFVRLTWLRVDDWMTRGGSELGTNRQIPDDNLGAVASKFQKSGFDGLFLIQISSEECDGDCQKSINENPAAFPGQVDG